MREHRNVSQQLTFDFDNINSWSYEKVTKSVLKQFCLRPANKLIVGLDEKYQQFKHGELIIALEWDNWSGYIVCAKNEKSESLVREIAQFIHDNYLINSL